MCTRDSKGVATLVACLLALNAIFAFRSAQGFALPPRCFFPVEHSSFSLRAQVGVADPTAIPAFDTYFPPFGGEPEDTVFKKHLTYAGDGIAQYYTPERRVCAVSRFYHDDYMLFNMSMPVWAANEVPWNQRWADIDCSDLPVEADDSTAKESPHN